MHRPAQPALAVRTSSEEFRSLSLPTTRGSTVTFPDYKSFMDRKTLPRSAYAYGLNGTPTTRALQARLSEMEGAHDTFLTPSGLMAITTVFMAVAKAGEVILLPETVYPPVKRFAADSLSKWGISVRYYDPLSFDDDLLTDENICLVWVETPGSMTMEFQDIRQISGLARARGILVGCDNSWASPLNCRPLELGADIVVEAVTKYLSGHSDLLLGSISVSNEPLAEMIDKCIRSLGIGVSPDECFLAWRGIETAQVRLERVEQSGILLAKYLAQHERVAEVLHPALPTFRYHKLWNEQYTGASGLFSILLVDEDERTFGQRFDNLKVFQLGASWGGSHSLMAPAILEPAQVAKRDYASDKLIRISVGLENPDILIEDLSRLLS